MNKDVRLARIRIGVVLGKDGGALGISDLPSLILLIFFLTSIVGSKYIDIYTVFDNNTLEKAYFWCYKRVHNFGLYS